MSPEHGLSFGLAHVKEHSLQTNMAVKHRDGASVASPQHEVDDWEEWEDDDVVTLIDAGEPLPAASPKLSSTNAGIMDINTRSSIDSNHSTTYSCGHISPTDANAHPGLLAPLPASSSVYPQNTKHAGARASRNPAGRISRLRSRRRQKAQNARLGIRLITDMTKFRRQNHMAHQIRPPGSQAPKFVDAAALRALEGSPTPESVGSWNWLKTSKDGNQLVTPTQQNARSPQQELSPEDRPIVIGITLPSDEVASRGINPQTATINTIETPIGLQNNRVLPPRPSADRPNLFSDANQPKSVWSPDTPDTVISFSPIRRSSSVYSQATMPGVGPGFNNHEVPPVPTLPANYKKTLQQRRTDDYEDVGSPCTLFEEDGTSTSLRSPRGKLAIITPDSAESRSYGWWDHVVTPFLDKRMSFVSRKQNLELSTDLKEHQAETAENKRARERLSSSKENIEQQPSLKVVAIKTERRHIPMSIEKTGELGSKAVKAEDNCVIAGPSILAKESLNGGDIKQNQTNLCLPTSENQQQSWTYAERAPAYMPSLRTATTKESAECTCSSNEVKGHQQKEAFPQSERHHVPSPKQIQPLVAQVVIPRQIQLHHPNGQTSNVSLGTEERSIPALDQSNMGEHRHSFVVNRQMNSTPTLRIPTPRRTPSPRVHTPGVDAPYESLARCASDMSQPETRETLQSYGTENAPRDCPPPYSPSGQQVRTPVRYQAVFPPDHRLHSNFALPNRTGSPGLASTMTSQGAGRRMDIPIAAPSRTDQPCSPAAYQIEPRASLPQEGSGSGAPISTRPGVRFLAAGDIEEASAVTQPGRAYTSDEPVHAAPAQSSTRGYFVPQLPSRFSVSPTSSRGSYTSDEGARTTQRRGTRGGHFVLGQQTRAALLPSSMRLPTDPRRAHLPGKQRSGLRNWTGGGALSGGYDTESLPTRPAGTCLPQEHGYAARGRMFRVERERRRHEKEDVMARRIGGFWRGRGCIPTKGCFGRAGREGRKRRRIKMGIITAIVLLLVLVIVLPVVLTRHDGIHEANSIWVNLTDFPPMPTGVLTVVGPDNTVARSGCTEPSTLWSCFLPKDDQSSVAPYQANQPTVIFQIQWDNSTTDAWNVTNGTPPVPVPVSRRSTGGSSGMGRKTRARSTIDGFSPNPSPPSFQEMWFLGETTDNVQSDEKAGEPAPFFISMLSSVNATVSFPSLGRRQGNVSLSDILPPPDLESDGTPVPAVMLPNPAQQPVRLYDRGLPTEHYGFYTYFKRTIFLKSVSVLNQTDDANVPLDEDGGCSKAEANYLVTWAQTRMLVQIWTRMLGQNNTSLLKPDGSGGIDNSTQLVRPGTMPYPVTVTLDTHGGDPDQKVVWEWPMDNRQQLQLSGAELLANNMAAGGTWINHRGSGDAQYGGFDGGTGGCKCEWVNWV